MEGGVAVSSTPLVANRTKRLAGFAVGLVLFYAPFALIARAFAGIAPNSLAGTSVTDVHTACLRSPWQWLIQPWMIPTLRDNPIYLLTILVLLVAAVLLGPLFCGWLCPAGALPEYLGRIVPDRFKFDPKRFVDIVPLRYGFFAGFLLAPFISASICCSFCNFTQMQNIVSASFGDPSGFAFLSSTSVITAALWIVPLGLFTLGGRGWCLFLCPAGTVMGISSAITARFPWARRMRTHDACVSCRSCEQVCSMRAITVAEEGQAEIDHRLCIGCMDCASTCKTGAIRYGRPS